MSRNVRFIVAAVRAWQADRLVHPLTCGSDSRHRPLVAITLDGTVTLRCPDCDYLQGHVPDIVLRTYDATKNTATD